MLNKMDRVKEKIIPIRYSNLVYIPRKIYREPVVTRSLSFSLRRTR